MFRRTRAVLLLAAIAPAVCIAAQPLPLAPSQLPGWHDDSLAGLHRAIERQCALPRPPQPWPAMCPNLPPANALKGWLDAQFVAWPLAREDGAPGLLTGYYEPVVDGSRHREHDGQAPLYRPPPDLVRGPDGSRLRAAARPKTADPPDAAAAPDTAAASGLAASAGTVVSVKTLQPYPSRAEIETGRLLAGRELVWLDDAVEAFFLQIQGSGRVRLRDGSTMRVGFADHNGQPYYPIGRELVARGALAPEAVDAEAIKAWLRAHPAEAGAVMRRNRRYVFFRELPDGDDGPPGSLGVALTPLRSVATDPAQVPPGALLFIDATHPDDGAPLRRAVLSQDRGAAITGAVRADLFWGAGDAAGQLAGRTKQPLRMWLLWPKGLAKPVIDPSINPSSNRPASG
ncbi:MAG: MltA domain-containing protein [Burkholderiaceae bacterium]|nr:MltA domain-containing protein [Burkholderiaceae bacterium]